MRLEYLPPPSVVRALLFPRGSPSADLIGPHEVLVHIRGSKEFVHSPHPDYPLLPISYYREAIRISGCSPVFMGETQSSPYISLLRDAFPKARVLAAGTPLEDFARIAGSAHIISSVSSFCWLAAWISSPSARIIMPVCGLLDPRQRSDVDLLPHDDDRFTYLDMARPLWRASRSQVKALSDPLRLTQITPAEVLKLKACTATESLRAAGAHSLVQWRRSKPSLAAHAKRISAGGRRMLLRLGYNSYGP